MSSNWLIIYGLLFAFLGLAIFVSSFLTPLKRALEVGVARIPGESTEENLKLPSVCDRLRQARRALLGLIFLIIGFALQVVGNLHLF